MDAERTQRNFPAAVVSLFLISTASLSAEVALTRFFSYLFIQSYVYIIISLSIAGIGFGAVLVSFIGTEKRIVLLSVASPGPLLLLLLLLHVNLLVPSLIVSLGITFLFYIFVGAVTVFLFQQTEINLSFLYAADLAGAAFGSLLCFLLLNLAGAWNTLLLVGFVFAAALFFLSTAITSVKRIVYVLLPVLIIIGVGGWAGDIDEKLRPGRSAEKEMMLQLSGGEGNPRITETDWTSFGRVDLLESDNPFFKIMYIDGAAGTKMVNMEGGKVSSSLAENLRYRYIGGLAALSVDTPKEEAMVLGSGGGIDVVTLLLTGYENISAVEINQDFIEMVREREVYTGGIYNQHPHVEVFVREGRSFLRQQVRSKQGAFDVIFMALPIIKSSRNFTNHALVENYLFTYDAISEYRRALTNGGALIVVTHYQNELLKLVSNVLKSFELDGVSSEEAMKRIAAVGSDSNPALIVKNSELTAEEIQTLYAVIDQLDQRGRTNFIPSLPQRAIKVTDPETRQRVSFPEFHQGLYGLASGALTLEQFVDSSTENISWISDDSPFFYQMNRFIPPEVGVVVLAACTIFFLLFVTFRRKIVTVSTEAVIKKRRTVFFFLFSFLGVGFILVEIGIIQKFLLFWEHQTMALSVILSLVLISSGLGSLASALVKRKRTLSLVLVIIAVITVIYTLFLGDILLLYESGTIPVKLLFSFVIIAPLFFFMGMPFPFLLKTLSIEEEGKGLFPWVMGANSITTFLGGGLSMMVALVSGYRFVLYIGAAAYLLFLAFLSRPVIGSHR